MAGTDDSRLRLLFVDFTLPHLLAGTAVPAGGWAVQLKHWLDCLEENGVHCGVLTLRGANVLVGKPLPYELVETYDPDAGVRVLKYLYSRAPALLVAARRFKPDAILQSTRSVFTFMMSMIAWRMGVPFVYRIASDADVDSRQAYEKKSYEQLAFRLGIRRADLLVCQNAYQIGQTKRRWPKTPRILLPNVIPMPVNPTPVRPRCDRAYIAWVGVFRKPKNLPLLAKIATELPDLSFKVAGAPDGAIDDGTSSALRALERLPNVECVGYLGRDRIASFLGGAIALLCTSHYEGFPNTFLEALLAGTPVISRLGVDPDGMIASNALGRIAQSDAWLPGNIREIVTLADSSFETLAQRCRDYVARKHAPADGMRRLVQTIRSLHTLPAESISRAPE